jgi:hypothetical protein
MNDSSKKIFISFFLFCLEWVIIGSVMIKIRSYLVQQVTGNFSIHMTLMLQKQTEIYVQRTIHPNKHFPRNGEESLALIHQ